MRIALRIFISYVLLSLLLGGATLFAARLAIGRLIESTVDEAAGELAGEIGIFLTASAKHSLDELTPEEQQLLQEQIRIYADRSERVETVLIADEDCRIRYASKPEVIGLRFRGEECESLSKDTLTVRDVGPLHLREITVPVKSFGGGKIAALRVQLIPIYFPAFIDRPPLRAAMWIFVGMILFITASGVLLASLLTIPVRRLNRMLLDLQQKGSAANVEVDERSDFAPALRVVRGLGKRLEELTATSRSDRLMLSAVTQTIEQGIVVLDGSGRILTINEAAMRMLGCVGGADSEAEAERLIASDPDLSRIVRSEAGTGAESLDIDARKDGKLRRSIRVSAYALREENGASNTMMLIRDLDSIRALERHLQEASRLSLIARLTRTFAHEIKNPLNSMSIETELLRQSVSSVPPRERARYEGSLQIILRQIHHLDEVIMDYAGLAASGEKETPSADVKEVVGSVVDLIRNEARVSNVRIETAIEPDLPPIPLAPVRLKQVLLNLCLNAMQAMVEGGVLTVRSRRTDGDVLVEVADTGPGIPEEIRSSIFDFDFTTKERGSGLGLPFTRIVVESGGGSVEFETEPGKGTTFRLRFPATEMMIARPD